MILVPVSREAFLPFLLCSLTAGVIFGVLYDIFRIRRRAFGSGVADVIAIALEDTLFCIFVAVTMILISYKLNYGIPRWYSYGGAFLGVIIWQKTGGRLVMKASEEIIRAIKRVLRFACRRILLPPINALKSRCRKVLTEIENKRARAYTAEYEKRLLDGIWQSRERSAERK